MPKTYVVGGNQGVGIGGIGGHRAIKIDSIPNPLACGGNALSLNPNHIATAVHVPNAGVHLPNAIANRLQNTFNFPPNNIWIYIRHGSNTFGLDRYGNFGEV